MIKCLVHLLPDGAIGVVDEPDVERVCFVVPALDDFCGDRQAHRDLSAFFDGASVRGAACICGRARKPPGRARKLGRRPTPTPPC